MTLKELRAALGDTIMEIRGERIDLQVQEKTLVDALKILEDRQADEEDAV